MIIDNGSHSLRFGLSTQEKPDQVIPSFARYSKIQTKIFDESSSNFHSEFLFGSKIFNDIDDKTRIEPFVNAGEIVSFDALMKVYSEVFKRHYKVSNQNTTFFICHSIHNNSSTANNVLFEHFFEKMEAAVIGLAPQVVLELFSVGLTSGLVVDVGHGRTQIAPIVEGMILKSKKSLEKLSGSAVNSHMANIFKADTRLRKNIPLFDQLKQRLFEFEYRHFSRILDERNLTESSGNFFSISNPDNYCTLPDSTVVYLKDIQDSTNSVFFSEKDNLPTAIQGVIDISVYKKIDKLLTQNLIITGGVANSFQFTEYVESGLNALKFRYLEGAFKAQALKSKPENSAWTGAKIVSGLPGANAYLVTRSEYEENGSRIFSQYRHEFN
jgi:actin-related protein